MAIQTGGFSPTLFPRYVGPDPSIVGGGGAALANGISSGVEMYDRIQSIKAKKAAQQELDATRQARLANIIASNTAGAAQSNSDLSLIPSTEEVKRVQLKNAIAEGTAQFPNIALRGTTDNLSLKKGIGDLTFQIDQQPTVQGTQTIANKGALANAPVEQTLKALDLKNAVTNAPVEQSIKSKTLAANDKLAGYNLRDVPIEHALKLIKLQDAIDNSTSDAELQRNKTRMQTYKDYADAEYNLGLGRESTRAAREKTTMDKISQIDTNIAKVSGIKYVIPDKGAAVPLNDYIAATRDEKQNIKQTGIPFMKSPANLNPDAENAIAQIQTLNKLKNRLIEGLNSAPAATTDVNKDVNAEDKGAAGAPAQIPQNPKEGQTSPIIVNGIAVPGTEMTYRNGAWIKTK